MVQFMGQRMVDLILLTVIIVGLNPETRLPNIEWDNQKKH